MKNTKRVGIIFGGASEEHEVSIMSAINIVNEIDTKKFETVLIGITKKGTWQIEDFNNLKKIRELKPNKYPIALLPNKMNQLIYTNSGKKIPKIDVFFPITHGKFGEDGSIQGVFNALVTPFVGSQTLASAVGMDKDIAKRLWRDAGINVAKFIAIKKDWVDNISFNKLKKELGIPFFIKPSRLGSSIGISKVNNSNEFKNAVDLAFKYDDKILIEEYIDGREIECGILGNKSLVASTPGEVITKKTFYSYDEKYKKNSSTTISIPAKLSKKQVKEIKILSIKAYETISCDGLARVDFFLSKNGKLILNEINTLPGFTNNSMYPKLFEYDGIKYKDLITKLINLALSNKFDFNQK